MLELLAHLLMLNDKEQNDRLVKFMDQLHSHPKVDPQVRADYIKSLQPDIPLITEKGGGAGQTDLNQLQQLKNKQLNGGK